MKNIKINNQSYFACEIQVWLVGLAGSLLCLKFGELVLDAFLHLGAEIDELLAFVEVELAQLARFLLFTADLFSHTATRYSSEPWHQPQMPSLTRRLAGAYLTM